MEKWRTGEFVMKFKRRLIIWDTMGLRGFKVDVNITLFYVLDIWV